MALTRSLVAPSSAPTSTSPASLTGKVLRSPHPHARIVKIDTSKAETLAGVKAVVTRDDFAEQASEFVPAGEMLINYRDICRNVMARDKVLYEGHPVAAVAATNNVIAKKALKLIDVEYEILPHVIDVLEAMKPDAPVLHEDMFTDGVDPKPDKPSNIAKQVEFALGDVEQGFGAADVIIEREFNTQPVHQGYIEPHACLANVSSDGTSGTLGHHSGPLGGARALCPSARLGRLQHPRNIVGNRRRVRRQDRGLS